MKNEKNIQIVRRGLHVLLVVAVILTGLAQFNATEVQAASAATKAKNAYYKFLSKPISWSGDYRQPSELKFGLIDINNDKVPELYVYTTKWDYDYDYKLFGYVNNKVKCLYSFRRFSKLQKVYPTRGVFVSYGEYNRGMSETIHFKYDGKKTTEKVQYMFSSLNGLRTYNIPSSGNGYKTISKSKYDSIIKSLVGSASYKKAPVLYKNTAANRKKYLKPSSSAATKPAFKKGTLYGFSNGGFYLQIHSITGNSMKLSIHMPEMTKKNMTAAIKSDGKTATTKFTCGNKKTHNLTISIAENGIKVVEKASCSQKLLGWTAEDKKKTSITHTFYPQSHFFEE